MQTKKRQIISFIYYILERIKAWYNKIMKEGALDGF
jgi:hypothetical protein